MQHTHIMECTSLNFVSSIFNWQGINVGKLDKDYGIDFMLQQVDTRPAPGGRTRFFSSGLYIDVQLKSCGENQVVRDFTANTITYNLKVNNYNDLILRMNEDSPNPLILILFILPEDINNTITVNPRDLVIRQDAYWYQPPGDLDLSNNTATQTIRIPMANKLDLSYNLFDILF